MALNLVSLPIGNEEDLTQRAIKTLQNADVLVGEEEKPARRWMARLDMRDKPLHLLNEHSQREEIQELASLCEAQNVALFSDAGSPGFCDPASALVKECRARKIPVLQVPGASALMSLLTLSSENLRRFCFWGFLPREEEERKETILAIGRERDAIVLMDTPYRLSKTLNELKEFYPFRKALLAADLTKETEDVLEGDFQTLAAHFEGQKKEFMLLIYGNEDMPQKNQRRTRRPERHSRGPARKKTNPRKKTASKKKPRILR